MRRASLVQAQRGMVLRETDMRHYKFNTFTDKALFMLDKLASITIRTRANQLPNINTGLKIYSCAIRTLNGK